MRQSLRGIKRDQSYAHLANSSTTNTPTSFLNEVQFTGAISDANTGLYYMNARYYNPNTGRFLSQDSYKGSAYEPWTQHLYTYCGNNPINMIDPTGHLPKGIKRYGSAVAYTDTGGQMVVLKSVPAAPAPQTPAPQAPPPQAPAPEYYGSEEEAAQAFLATNVPITANDSLERSAYIAKDPIIGITDKGNIKITGYKYKLSQTYTGFWANNGAGFVGWGSLFQALQIAGAEYSMVHTHPASYQDGSICKDGFSGLPGDGMGDYKMITLLGATNVYMGNHNSNNVFKLTIAGEDKRNDGTLNPCGQY